MSIRRFMSACRTSPRMQVDSFCHVPRQSPVSSLQKLCTRLFTASSYAWQAPTGIQRLNPKQEEHADIRTDLWEDFPPSSGKNALSRAPSLPASGRYRVVFRRRGKKSLEHTSLASGDHGGCHVPEFIWPQTVHHFQL